MGDKISSRVQVVVRQIQEILSNTSNYLFSDPLVEDLVEDILDEIIEQYPEGSHTMRASSCGSECGCSEPRVVIPFSVLHKLLLMLVEARVHSEGLSECLSEMEEDFVLCQRGQSTEKKP